MTFLMNLQFLRRKDVMKLLQVMFLNVSIQIYSDTNAILALVVQGGIKLHETFVIMLSG